MPVFVLIHSPLVGPATWAPVAEQLRASGRESVVPSLLAVGEGGPPYWPRVAAAVAAGLADAGIGAERPLVLVAHSQAGLFVPVLIRELGRPVRRVILADARFPGGGESVPVVEGEFLAFLRGRVGPDRRLPRWTDWWDQHELAALLPDRAAARALIAEQPRLPLAYFLDQVPVPVPPGWPDRACAYLRFSDIYLEEEDRARALGWPVLTLPGGHLHQVVDPAAVAGALIELAGDPADGD